MASRHVLFLLVAALLFSALNSSAATSYFVDSQTGNDANDGHSPEKAWRSLEKASSAALVAGDQLLLKCNTAYTGHLVILRAAGTAEHPVIVSSYGDGAIPKIDSAGYLAGVKIVAGKFLEVSNIEITSDAGDVKEPIAKKQRYGVVVTAFAAGSTGHISLGKLKIHDIFASEQVPGEGRNATSNMGAGIEIAPQETAIMSDLLVENCDIQRTGSTGISIHCRKAEGDSYALHDIQVVNNNLKDIGGPGIQPDCLRSLLVRGNSVDGSGSSKDPRMHGRGSGIWPWMCDDVLIEKNRFLHARGKADSCGMHIDFNCRNVVGQYNFSFDNEGGFIEILGRDYNCSYRYNISVNDGSRIKGVDGAMQSAKTLCLSGYVGKGPPVGPFNTYIYNNTIFTKQDIHACFSIGKSTEGVLIANNIFDILGPTEDVQGDQNKRLDPRASAIRNAVFRNNLYCRAQLLPRLLPIHDTRMLIGDAEFAQPGGTDPADYIPAARALVQHKGIAIERLPGDTLGLKLGLSVTTDFFGKPIVGLPDLGAVNAQ